MAANEWNVVATDVWQQWYDRLDEAADDAMTAAVDRLVAAGPTLVRPHVGEVLGSSIPHLKELRVKVGGRSLRTLFTFDADRTAVLLCAGDKTGRWNDWYPEAIKQAEALYEKYLADVAKDRADAERDAKKRSK